MSNRLKRIIPILIVFLLFFIMSMFIVSREDDLVFKDAIVRYGSFGSWVRWFASNWGGRIIPQGLLVLLLQLPDLFFHVINAFFGTVLVFFTSRIVDFEEQIPREIWLFGIPLLGIMFLPAELLAGTVLWKCAAVLYVWGLATFFISLVPYVNIIYQKKCSCEMWLLAFIAAVYTASFEQAGVLLATICVLLFFGNMIHSRKFPSIGITLLTVETVGFTVFFCTLPGNHTRFAEETACWYQGFETISLPEKILNGINYAISNIENVIMPVMILIAALATIAIIKKGYRMTSIGALLALGYLVLCEINTLGNFIGSSLGHFSSVFLLQSFETAIFEVSWLRIVAMTIHFMVYVSIGCIVALAVEEKSRAIVFLLYYGGLCTMIIMGFSPTIHASGSRPCFICFYLMIVIVIKLIGVLNQAAAMKMQNMNNIQE